MAKLELFHIDNKQFQYICYWNQHKILYKLVYFSITFSCYIMNFLAKYQIFDNIKAVVV